MWKAISRASFQRSRATFGTLSTVPKFGRGFLNLPLHRLARSTEVLLLRCVSVFLVVCSPAKLLAEIQLITAPVCPALSQGGATVESPFDILQKIDDVNFLWIEEVRDLPTAIARIEELQARTPGEYVVFDQRTQKVVAQRKSRATGA